MDDQDEMRRGDFREHAKHLGEVCKEIGLTPVQAHAPFPIHKEGDGAYNTKMLEVTKQCLEICSLIGIPVLVIHPWNNWDAEENKTRWFSRLYPEAERDRVIIATENMWNWDKSKNRATKAACSSPKDFFALCALMNRPYFKACVDVGHANMALEGSALGAKWAFGPMCDIARDARWGRNIEGGGEDVYLAEEMSKAKVRGLQGKGTIDSDHMMPTLFASTPSCEAIIREAIRVSASA